MAVRKRIDQVFGMLPDAAVHIGDAWLGKTVQKGELTFNVKSNFKLKEVDGGVATIESKGEVAYNDEGKVNSPGCMQKRLLISL